MERPDAAHPTSFAKVRVTSQVEERDGADYQTDFVGSELRYSQEAPLIQQNLSLFEEVMSSLASDDEIRKNELLREIYLGSFKDIRQKILVLIDNYQDDEGILASLLCLNDRMEEILAQYLSRIGDTEVTFTDLQSNNTNDTNLNRNSDFINRRTSDFNDFNEFTDYSYNNNGFGSDNSDSDSSDSDDELYSARKYGKQRKIDFKGKGKAEEKDFSDVSLAPEQSALPKEEKHINSTNVNNGEDTEEKVSPADVTFKIGYKIPEGPGSCPICYTDDIPPENLYIYAQCSHQYCKECLTGYYETRINEGKVLDIVCPDPSCNTQVEYHQVQDIVSGELWSKYEEFTFLASLNADPTVRWCPRPGCGNAIIGDPENPHCQCTNSDCRYEFCFLCRQEWHPNATCEQYQQWREENGLSDTKFDKWAKKNTKKCPNCKTMIEKMAGCNHMTCSGCKFEFCWLCGGKYSSSHFDVFNVFGCPGMQSGSKQFGVARRIGMRALIGTGLVLGGVIGAALAIPVVVVGGPIYGGYKLHQRRMRQRRRRHYW